MWRFNMLVSAILLMTDMLAVLAAGNGCGHPLVVSNIDHGQLIANGQNHPGFVFDSESELSTMCEGVNEPPKSGPAAYAFETAP